MKVKRIETLLFQSLYLVAALIIIAQVLGIKVLSSLLFTLTFPLTVGLWLFSVRENRTKLDYLVVLTAALACVCVIVDGLISHAELGFSYLKKAIMFVMTLLFFQTAYRTRASKGLMRFINLTVDVLTVFLLFMHIFFRDQMHSLNDIPTKYVAFHFSNPNLVCMFLVCMYMLKFTQILQPGDLRQKIIRGAVAAVLAFFVYDTRSRNGLLVILLYTLVGLYVIFREKIRDKWGFSIKLRITKTWAWVVATIPAAFAVLYMALISSGWVDYVFAFITGEGKKLDSRVKVWSPAMQAIFKSPIFGGYCSISDGTGVSQMHNTHLDIAASYGIPVLVLVCILLMRYVYQDGKSYKSKTDFLYMVGFCCALLLGIFEAALFSGGLGIYIYMGTFLLLVAPKREQVKKQETL